MAAFLLHTNRDITCADVSVYLVFAIEQSPIQPKGGIAEITCTDLYRPTDSIFKNTGENSERKFL